MHDVFSKFASKISHTSGSPGAFLVAVSIILIWAVTGPIFKFSDVWQLVINTGTTIVTFLMVFLIQNTQNREAESVNLKLNELISATKSARNQLIDIEEMSDTELKKFRTEYRKRAKTKAKIK